MKRILIGLFFIVLSSNILAQQSTTGPVPPPGLGPGLKPDKMTQTVISGVPTYIWHNGCGPTALGMVIGYYDSHSYPSLVPGDATSQNSAVNAMIADDSDSPTCGGPASDHYQDYACPIDYSPNMETDRSQTGGAHIDNCVADFMKTSQSAYGNYYGWSWFSDVDDAFEDYVNFIDPSLYPQADNYYFSQLTWEDYKTEIDNNRPVVLLVDTDGDGSTDHFVPGVGYDDDTFTYGVYNTWDHSLHWYVWRPVSPGYTWGVYGATLVSLSQFTVTETDPADSETGVITEAEIRVTFNMDLNVSTLNEYNVIVTGSKSDGHSLTMSYSPTTRTANIVPDVSFNNSETVEVFLSGYICSSTGIPMGQDFSFNFTTVSCCVDLTGNTNCSESEEPDISDITRLIDYLYISHNPLCCPEEADVDVSGGEPDISDITFLIDHLYLSHRALYSCPGK